MAFLLHPSRQSSVMSALLAINVHSMDLATNKALKGLKRGNCHLFYRSELPSMVQAVPGVSINSTGRALLQERAGLGEASQTTAGHQQSADHAAVVYYRTHIVSSTPYVRQQLTA